MFNSIPVRISSRALNVLRNAEYLRAESGLVFPSIRGKELSDMTLSKLVREQNIPCTVHGFRSSFRTWAQECSNVAGEVAEAALAHVNSNKVEAAYARSDLFEKRKNLIEDWARYLSRDWPKTPRNGRRRKLRQGRRFRITIDKRGHLPPGLPD
jgi:integrase